MNNSPQKIWQLICASDTFEESLKKLIGRGRFANVYRHEISGIAYAVKRYEFSQILENFVSPPMCIEDVEFLSKTKHKNIVRLCYVKRSDSEVFLFFEFMEGGTLKTLIKTLNEAAKFMQEETALMYTAQILNGLDYLHVRSMAHRDVKPENLLLSADLKTIKLSDFNLSKHLATSVQSCAPKGTWCYMAPEVLRCDKYNVKSDIWSVGATLVEMLCGAPLFSKYETDACVVHALYDVGLSKPKPDYDLAVRSDLTSATAELLDEIFQPLAVRPSAAILLSRDCFSAFDHYLCLAENDTSYNINEYSIDIRNKGNALIINNETYAKSSNREGSRVDVNRLKDIFGIIRYKFKVETNLLGDAIVDSIRSFFSDEETRQSSSVIIVIMAHGTSDAVLGVDEVQVTLQSILDVLFQSGDKLLVGKPKMLLIQACRGKKVDVANTNEIENVAFATYYDESSLPLVFEKDSSVHINAECQAGLRTKGDEDLTQLECAPSKSDVIVAYSTYDNFAALRSINDGSYYVQSFCEVVRKYWKSHHVLDILTETHRLTASAVLRDTKTFTQVPQLVASLRKQYFLSHSTERKVERTQNTSAQNCAAAPQNTQEHQLAAPSSIEKPTIMEGKQILLVTGGHQTLSTFAYDTSSNTWRRVASRSCFRKGTAATLWNGKVVVAGGWNFTNDYLNSVEQYDPETDSWTALPSMLCRRSDLAIACFDNTLFAIGGGDGTNYLDSVELYNLNARQWQTGASLNVRRVGVCCAVLELGILAAGGHDGVNRLNTCEFFDGAGKTWKFVASLAIARSSASAATLNNKVYVFGGYGGKDLDSVEEYEWLADKWTLLPVRLSELKHALAAAAVNGQIYICGGAPDSNVVESFDASLMQITRVSSLPEAIRGAAAVSLPMPAKVFTQLFEMTNQKEKEEPKNKTQLNEQKTPLLEVAALQNYK